MIEGIAPALATPAARLLPLDRGPTSVREFGRLASAHLRGFTFDRLSRGIVAGIRDLADAPPRRSVAR